MVITTCFSLPLENSDTSLKGCRKYLDGLVPGRPADLVRDELPAFRGHALAVRPPVRRRARARLVVLPRPVARVDPLRFDDGER
jgi:hypothetical protein